MNLTLFSAIGPGPEAPGLVPGGGGWASSSSSDSGRARSQCGTSSLASSVSSFVAEVGEPALEAGPSLAGVLARPRNPDPLQGLELTPSTRSSRSLSRGGLVGEVIILGACEGAVGGG